MGPSYFDFVKELDIFDISIETANSTILISELNLLTAGETDEHWYSYLSINLHLISSSLVVSDFDYSRYFIFNPSSSFGKFVVELVHLLSFVRTGFIVLSVSRHFEPVFTIIAGLEPLFNPPLSDSIQVTDGVVSWLLFAGCCF